MKRETIQDILLNAGAIHARTGNLSIADEKTSQDLIVPHQHTS
jgi:hypothetical protein